MTAYELSADDAADRAAEWVMLYGIALASLMVGLTESDSVREALIRECRSWAIAQGMSPTQTPDPRVVSVRNWIAAN